MTPKKQTDTVSNKESSISKLKIQKFPVGVGEDQKPSLKGGPIFDLKVPCCGK